MIKLVSDLDRLFSKLSFDEETGCWLWTGNLDRDGYAQSMKVGSRTDDSRRTVIPHRLIYSEMIEPIPEGFTIDHLCRNRACENPWHMEPVTSLVNTQRGSRATATHCKYGHPFSGANLRVTPLQRVCRACARRWAKENRNRIR